MLQVYELMNQGKMNGYLAQGFNPLAAAPNKAKLTAGFSKLKYLVIMDPLVTETSEFWRNAGEANDVDPSKIQTEVFRLPTTCFAEEDGALVNSGRWLQWHWKGAEPPGEAKSDIEIMSLIFTRLRKMYQDEGGKYPDPIVNLSWPYSNPQSPTAEELAKEYSGKALADLADPKDPTRITRKAGEQLAAFAELRDDGSTASGCWIFAGAWSPAGNLMARRDNSDPTGIGQTLNWAWAWPANRRILYNRASCDVAGKLRPAPQPDCVERQELGRRRCAGLQGRRESGRRHGAVHHEPRGRGALLRPRGHGRGSVPRALRAVRDAAGLQPAASQGQGRDQQPGRARVQGRPGGDGHGGQVPVRGHHLPPDRALPLLDQERPHQRDPAARAVRRDRRGDGQGTGHRQRPAREGVLEPRLHQGRGAGDRGCAR